MSSSAPQIPPSLRPIAHYVNIAKQHEKRDLVVYYWCMFYSVQTGMSIDKSSQEALKYLTSLLSTLEVVKKQLAGQEALTQDMVAQAHIENYALKLFEFADRTDRQGNYADIKSIAKAFYTAGYLIDVLTLFGELDENLVATRKYAKWKAAYLTNCAKKGETPVPGPAGGQSDAELNLNVPPAPTTTNVSPPGMSISPSAPGGSQDGGFGIPTQPAAPQKPKAPARDFSSSPAANPVATAGASRADGSVSMEAYLEAQKYTKYALSALAYEDAESAIENMEKALAILKAR